MKQTTLEHIMSNWVLEGLRVKGLYMGEIPVSGRVELSRVKYGGAVSHHIVLDQPTEVYRRVRDRVILEHKEITQVYSSLNDLI
jgi:hypothetical protein